MEKEEDAEEEKDEEEEEEKEEKSNVCHWKKKPWHRSQEIQCLS